ncbi:tRNA (adenosine(37)-N6)-threonylcarbamoyltransferase complex transferase subunit TsaD [Candidatus Saccharibacteria bacterium]|nr:tRNA (adenosine(37)-N6)-threonylcarbamoyltransferase complex transferase subunit TsaD [Candidatus Saccharibacteria bacterium]MCB9821145.1 tRNA (adenosine(37)-N6)-threonylcarbamoyltransferase complex transferase subunit TsaD [Candidatus Nomurabacteria bacterium]
MKILGIESSCDETAAAVIEDGQRVQSSAVLSQIDIHARYGGVVPEIAARSHLEAINPIIQTALDEAACSWDDIDAIAVTYGAGLSGSLLIGTLAARVLAIVKNKPLQACNHVVGHVFANFLTEGPEDIRNSGISVSAGGDFLASSGIRRTQSGAVSEQRSQKSTPSATVYPAKKPEFPMLALIVSGKHSQLAYFESEFDYRLLGEAQDDAIGEAFDKIAKILGLAYPGGPSIAKTALNGNPQAYPLPTPQVEGYNFSFSGLKTAVLRLAQGLAGGDYRMPSFEVAKGLSEAQIANIAASFQFKAVKIVVDKTVQAYNEFLPKSVVIAGGVAASQELRRQLSDRLPIEVSYAPPELCTDNGAMIGCLGCYQALAGQTPADPYTLAIDPSLKM